MMSPEEYAIRDRMISSLIASMIEELERDQDERRALRKALVFLINLVQADLPETAIPYVAFLLTRFPPLSNYFSDNLHPFVRGEYALRTVIVGDRVALIRVWQGDSLAEQNVDGLEAP